MATFLYLETKGVTWTHKLLFEWGLTNRLEINRNFGVWLCRFPRGVQVQTTHWFDIIISLCFGKHLHSYDIAG